MQLQYWEQIHDVSEVGYKSNSHSHCVRKCHARSVSPLNKPRNFSGWFAWEVMTLDCVGDDSGSLVGWATTPEPPGEGHGQGLWGRQGEGKWWALRLFCGWLWGCHHHLSPPPYNLTTTLLLMSGQTYVLVCTTTNICHKGTCLVALSVNIAPEGSHDTKGRFFKQVQTGQGLQNKNNGKKKKLMQLMVLPWMNVCQRKMNNRGKKMTKCQINRYWTIFHPVVDIAIKTMSLGSETGLKI